MCTKMAVFCMVYFGFPVILVDKVLDCYGTEHDSFQLVNYKLPFKATTQPNFKLCRKLLSSGRVNCEKWSNPLDFTVASEECIRRCMRLRLSFIFICFCLQFLNAFSILFGLFRNFIILYCRGVVVVRRRERKPVKIFAWFGGVVDTV